MNACPVVSDSFWPHGLWPARVQGISQAKIPQWVTISSSRGSSPSTGWTHISLCLLHCRGFFTTWVAGEAQDQVRTSILPWGGRQQFTVTGIKLVSVPCGPQVSVKQFPWPVCLLPATPSLLHHQPETFPQFPALSISVPVSCSELLQWFKLPVGREDYWMKNDAVTFSIREKNGLIPLEVCELPEGPPVDAQKKQLKRQACWKPLVEGSLFWVVPWDISGNVTHRGLQGWRQPWLMCSPGLRGAVHLPRRACSSSSGRKGSPFWPSHFPQHAPEPPASELPDAWWEPLEQVLGPSVHLSSWGRCSAPQVGTRHWAVWWLWGWARGAGQTQALPLVSLGGGLRGSHHL